MRVSGARRSGLGPQQQAAGAGRTPATITLERMPWNQAIRLNWEANTCLGATGYGIYEGVVGDWYSHAPVACTDTNFGIFSEWILYSPGNRYYLVVPHNALAVGSFGLDSEAQERSVATWGCLSAQILGCP